MLNHNYESALKLKLKVLMEMRYLMLMVFIILNKFTNTFNTKEFNFPFSYFLGECVVTLKDMYSVQPEPFEYMLTHLGDETGIIR